jgi:hypothetical protein
MVDRVEVNPGPRHLIDQQSHNFRDTGQGELLLQQRTKFHARSGTVTVPESGADVPNTFCHEKTSHCQQLISRDTA